MKVVKTYAAIGSRDLSKAQLAFCHKVGAYMAHHGWVLHTGAAQGADQAYAYGALVAGGRVMLHLPWDTYERQWIAEMRRSADHLLRTMSVEDSPQYSQATGSVFVFHPNGEHLSRSVLLLHARNYNILCPVPGKTVNFVAAYPRNGRGGTMQGVRVAAALHVPVVRLDELPNINAQQQISEFVQEGLP